MRKILILVTTALIAISALFVAAFFGVIPLGEPSLKLDFESAPPWHVRPGNAFEVGIIIVNNAWMLAVAKNVRVEVVTPEGFTISGTNTNEWNKNFGTMRGRDCKNETFTLAASSNVLPGNYTVTVSVLAENAPKQIFTPQIVVELPYIP